MKKNSFDVVIEQTARDDIIKRVKFLANVNVSASKTLKNKIIYACKSLRRNPYRFSVYEYYPSYRHVVVGACVILYAIDEESKTVYIDHVIDARMDLGIF